MPIRNPFARRPGAAIGVQDENARPADDRLNPSHPGFEKVDTVGSKASSALSINSGPDNGEYKMSGMRCCSLCSFPSCLPTLP